ncbi:MAG: threonylcarbamoyl-AMP synthase [Proteobacteria bacterium]|nr:threonylcarbamoyl-AMP synthase [Pseudomonadota bacterium]
MISASQLALTVDAIKHGDTIAYPTEAVFGLGCDPFNQQAVLNLLRLKQRCEKKGLILIASHLQQVLPLIKPQHANDLARALKTWPGHYTWIFPKSSLVPAWIAGDFDTVAVRVSSHPVVKQICDKLNTCIVSTSANISKQGNLISINSIKSKFNDKIRVYLDAELGRQNSPSVIVDAHTNKIIR